MLLNTFYFIFFLLGGIVVSYTINILLLRFSRSLGIRNKNDVTVRWSNESKPSLGGVSYFIVFLFSTMSYAMVFNDENIFMNEQYVGLFLAAVLAFAMGLADDAYNTKPLFKLAIQILCGLILVWTNSVILASTNYYINATITVLWVVLIMNSLNMLDNMDGITATVVLFILISCLISNLILHPTHTNVWAISLIAMIGASIGFLILNVHPSKLFMGDAGSQFIGLFVSFFAVHELWNSAIEAGTNNWLSVFVVLVAFTPAAADTLTVVINRLKRGQSPMVGGKDHTTHHLVYAGYNDIGVWYVFLVLSILSAGFATLMLYLLRERTGFYIAFFGCYTLAVFIFLYRNTIKYPFKP